MEVPSSGHKIKELHRIAYFSKTLKIIVKFENFIYTFNQFLVYTFYLTSFLVLSGV